MAHIRRKFMDDATLQHIPWVKELLDLVKKLYAIERNLRKKNAPPDEVKMQRLWEARPIIEQIETLLRDHQPLYRPSDSCFGAIPLCLRSMGTAQALFGQCHSTMGSKMQFAPVS